MFFSKFFKKSKETNENKTKIQESIYQCLIWGHNRTMINVPMDGGNVYQLVDTFKDKKGRIYFIDIHGDVIKGRVIEGREYYDYLK